MEVAEAIGLAMGIGGIILSAAVASSQLSEARINTAKFANYLYDFHANMIARFDKLDASVEALARSVDPGDADG